MSWTVIAPFVVDSPFGYQEANALTQNLVALASRRASRFLGGSRVMPNHAVLDPLTGRFRSKSAGLGPWDAYDYLDIEIDGTNQTGLTYQARVAVRTDRATVALTPKVRNITDGTDAGVGVACSASDGAYNGTNQKQTIALTIASGIKTYRLMFTLSDLSGSSWLSGEIEAFATA